jgi:hypothetical protein
MDILMIVLRLFHIISGVFWAGTAFFFVSFLQPVVRASGPEGGKVMQQLALSRFTTTIVAAGTLTVLSGLLMYWRDSGFQLAWILSPTGIAFTIGGLAGLSGLGVAFSVSRPAIMRVAALAKEMMAAGGPPTPAQMGEIQALQARITQGGRWLAALLGIAVTAMAVARYL